jgi:hypothetical protein
MVFDIVVSPRMISEGVDDDWPVLGSVLQFHFAASFERFRPSWKSLLAIRIFHIAKNKTDRTERKIPIVGT